MSPLGDYLCLNPDCEEVTEELMPVLPFEIVCPKCGEKAVKLPPLSNFSLGKGAWEKNNYNG